jgi:hypothetical protein
MFEGRSVVDGLEAMVSFKARGMVFAMVLFAGGLPAVAHAHSVGVDMGAGAPSGSIGISARYQPMPKGFLELFAGQGGSGYQVGLGMAPVLGRRMLSGGTGQVYLMAALSMGLQDKSSTYSWTPASVRPPGTYHWFNVGVGVEWFRRGGITLGSEAGTIVRVAMIPETTDEPSTPRTLGAYWRLLRVGFAF